LRPVLVVVLGRPVSAFRLLQWCGLVAGVLVAGALGARAGLDGDRVVVAEAVVLVAGMVGAHWLAALAGGARSVAQVRAAAARRSVALWGALLAVGAGAIVVVVTGLPLDGFADAAMAGAMAACAFGRLGCLARGCCAGRPSRSRIAVDLPDAAGARARRLPTQALDAAWALALVIVAVVLVGRVNPGAGALLLAAGYCLGRVLTDWTREERPRPPRFSRTQRLLTVLLILACLAAGLTL
jgi:phosphatidylglycerol:prolipoprotein diacylglycerol transferase